MGTCTSCKGWKPDDDKKKTCADCRSYHRGWITRKKLEKFGLKPWEYDRILADQGGGCAICGIEENQVKKQFALDHDHKTNAFRGLLCQNCNVGLGNFRDSPEILYRAIHYLLKNKKKKAN